MICLFSGDAAAVGVILQLMCFNRDPKLWNIPVEDLEQDKNLCEEPLPLNRAGETPLDVARQAGHFEEIVQIYKALGLPTKSIKDQLWLARCADVMKKIVEKRGQTEREKNEIKHSSFYKFVMDYSKEDINEDVSVFFSRLRCTTVCGIDFVTDFHYHF